MGLKTSLIDKIDKIPTTSKNLHVVIVGAGIAGLCAAYELEKRGHTITILEADPNHIGGRVRTLRFDNGLYGELGAMRIPQKHELTLHYVNKFGLPLRKFVDRNPDAYYYIRGHKERRKNATKLNQYFKLTGWEKTATPNDLWQKAIGEILSALSTKEQADLFALGKTTQDIDRLSMHQLCERAGLSQEAIAFLAITQGIETLMPNAATEHLREAIQELFSNQFYEIVGGFDLFPTAFVKRLRSKPVLGCEVVRLEQDPINKCASAIYRYKGKLKKAEGDFVLCTLPFSVLNRLEINPAFSALKQRAIQELKYQPATKILAITKKRFWELDDKIFGGGTFTDLPTGMTYYPSDNTQAKNPLVSHSPSVMLASYTWGEAALQLDQLDPEKQKSCVIKNLSHLHPQITQLDMLQKITNWSWNNHEWSKGAFAFYLPSQHSDLYEAIIAPEGRIYFAGEHASLKHSWMQGALESALQAVQEMLILARSVNDCQGIYTL